MTKQSILNITPQEFLTKIWGQKPHFMPQSLQMINAPVSPDELAGMAGEGFVESRLIIHDPKTNQWQLKCGPFREKDFATLPDKGWTLLVQDVDKFLPEVASLLETTSFLPNYWLDDVMISYAREGGSVGAHLDRYHVFLIQAAGHRQWQIEETARQQEEYIPDIDIRMLKHFHPTQVFETSAGDVLYIPPHVAHHGIALDHDCVTYSIGFRAPSQLQMLSSFIQHLEQTDAAEKLLEDPQPTAVCEPGKLQPAHIDLAREFLISAIKDTPSFVEWFGRFLSEPKFRLDADVDLQLPSELLVRDENCRAYYYEESTYINLFVDGRSAVIPLHDRDLAKAICNQRTVHWTERQVPEWLSELIRAGFWYWA